LVADTPQEFANSVIRLIQDNTLQEQLATKGRKLAERQYDWKVILKRMEKIYDPLRASGG
jgi:glycosyltransferase involved in cell wall biosynthesis